MAYFYLLVFPLMLFILPIFRLGSRRWRMGVVGGVSNWLLEFWRWAWGVRLSGLTVWSAVFSHPLFSFSFPLPSAEPHIPESRFSYLCSPEIKLASLVQAIGEILGGHMEWCSLNTDFQQIPIFNPIPLSIFCCMFNT